MCAVDWRWELGEARGGTVVYGSIKDLQRHRTCVKQCGIVQVEVKMTRQIRKENFDWRGSGIKSKAKSKSS